MSAVREADLQAALNALAAGQVVGIPTDTIYGLAVLPALPGAVDALFALKGRPVSVEIPVLVADLAQAESIASFTAPARRLADRLWPGALTIVLSRRVGVDWALGGDGRSVGIRCPAHPLARALCAAAGPLAVTSANLHGNSPLTDAASVRDAFGPGLGAVVDGGLCAGDPSTVVDATVDPARCLRQGALAWDEVLAALNE